MANITREAVAQNHDKLIIELNTNDFNETFEKSLKQYGRQVQIKGFKKGNVPINLVRKMHGSGILAEELYKISYAKLNEYLSENNIQIFAQPMVSNMPKVELINNQPAEAYVFEYEVGLRPEFNIDVLNNVETFQKYSVSVSDDMVKEEIDRMQMRTGEMTNPETVTDENTILNVDIFECDASGKLIENAKEFKNSFLLNYINEDKRAAFMNKKVGDSVVLKFSDAFSSKLEKLMSKDLELDASKADDMAKHFSLTITKIGFVAKSELNQDFFNKVFPSNTPSTEEEFINLIKTDIANQWENASMNLVDNEIFEALIHKTNIDLPSTFLKNWLKYRNNDKVLTDVEVETEYHTFDHQLRWTLISDKIAMENNIAVSRDDVKEAFKLSILRYFGMMPQGEDTESMLDGYAENMLKNREEYDKVANEILANKILGFCRSKVVIQEHSVTPDEFNAKSKEESHYHKH